MRHPLIMGNWKLNGNKYMVHKLIIELRKELDAIVNCNVAIAPPSIYLDLAKYHLNNSKIMLGAQNVDIHVLGAYTGEISAVMLKDIGVKYVIIGHSERRAYHKENNELIANKFAILKTTGLIPVLCIGESEVENKAKQAQAVCAYQIDTILNKLGVQSFEDSIIAYEPIWAIGTGKSAPPAQVQEMHKFIRNYIANYDERIAEQIIIQYGGSVNANNANDLFNQPDIDGALIGNASLKADVFTMIVKTAAKAKTKFNDL